MIFVTILIVYWIWPLLGERDRVDVARDAPADPPGLGGRQAGAAVAQVAVEAPGAKFNGKFEFWLDISSTKKMFING